jgi:eukaryotic-like serine/threonine-protein kinase
VGGIFDNLRLPATGNGDGRQRAPRTQASACVRRKQPTHAIRTACARFIASSMDTAETIIGPRVKSFIQLVLLGLVLIIVALVSALTAMRFAIHGTEVTVPKLVGLTPGAAEGAAVPLGISVVVERQYYSSEVPEGRVLMQVPTAGTKVRRGFQVRVAESLGPQRVQIPDVLGQSGRAAELNIERRGLDVGSVAYMPVPGSAADQVIAQSPSGVSMPKISLLITGPPPPQAFVMPSFVGAPLGSANRSLLDAGFRLGNVTMLTPSSTDAAATGGAPAAQANPGSIVVSQSPPPGQKVNAGAAVNFEVR